MRLPHPDSRRRGLTRPEILWTVMLTVVIAGLIVRTLSDELLRGRERYVQDTLHYLQAQIYLAMEIADAEGRPLSVEDFPLVGPGELPAGIDFEDTNRLADLMPEGVWVPVDPWNRAYVLRLIGRPDNRRVQLLSAGPDGVLPDDLEEAPAYSKPVHGPVAAGP